MESCFGKEKQVAKLKRQMIIYNEHIEKCDWDNKKSEKQVRVIIYWKLYRNNECVAQEGFLRERREVFMNLRCIAGIRRWQEVLRRPSWCFLKMGVCSALVQREFIDGDVAVADGIVIGVGTYEGETEIDLKEKQLSDLTTVTGGLNHSGDAG